MPVVRRGTAFRLGRPVRGLAVYPGSPCYDPDRPSWLPYWIDDLSESGCKFQFYPGVTTLANPPTPPAVPAPAAPQTAAQMLDYTPDQASIDTQTSSVANAQNFLNTVMTAPTNTCGGGTGDWTQATWNDTTTWCTTNWLIAAGLGIGVVLFLTKGKGR